MEKDTSAGRDTSKRLLHGKPVTWVKSAVGRVGRVELMHALSCNSLRSRELLSRELRSLRSCFYAGWKLKKNPKTLFCAYFNLFELFIDRLPNLRGRCSKRERDGGQFRRARTRALRVSRASPFKAVHKMLQIVNKDAQNYSESCSKVAQKI